jgi:hypothetical protein
MTEALLNYFWIDTLLQKERGVAVPQIVKPNSRDSGALDHPAEVTADDIVSPKRSSVWLAEDKVMLLVGGAAANCYPGHSATS